MTDWSFGDTVGIVVMFLVTLSAAGAVDGIAQALVTLVGVVIILLWIANFVLRGYNETFQTPDTATD